MMKKRNELEPDWSHWLNMAKISPHEAILLSLNVEPRLINDKRPQPRIALTLDQRKDLHLSQASREERREQLFSAISARTIKSNYDLAPLPLDLSVVRIGLTEFVNWVTHLPRPWKLPRELKNLEVVRVNDVQDKRELKSYQKLLIALAIHHYQYDPTARRSTVTAKIHRLLKNNALSLSEETIRNCLKESYKLIERE
jgi:hypothetical protein